MRAGLLACCLLVSGAAVASELDDDDETEGADAEVVEAPDDGQRIGRVAAELAAGLLGAALPHALWVPFLAMGGQGSSTAGIFMLFTSALLTPVTLSTSIWLVHRKMKGRGYWAAAWGGAMFGAAIGGGAFALYAHVSNFSGSEYLVLAAGGGIVLMLAATVFMIELHHDNRVSAAIAPLPGGVMATVGMRF